MRTHVGGILYTMSDIHTCAHTINICLIPRLVVPHKNLKQHHIHVISLKVGTLRIPFVVGLPILVLCRRYLVGTRVSVVCFLETEEEVSSLGFKN